jgi:hypothetical protein
VAATLDLALGKSGYAFVEAPAMRDSLERCGSLSDWPAFAGSWNDLAIDRYRAEHARDRRRRFAVYAIDRSGSIARQPHQPHYQQPQYNVLFGGIERWFAPMTPEAGASAALDTTLRCADRIFRPLAPAVDRWRVEVHQFRIEARADAPGEPTPEGVHRDGVDFVLVLLVSRENIIRGTTTVYDLDGRALGSFTLTDPLDAALVDDARVAHGVTAIAPLDPARPGYRDVLVATFRSATFG